MTVSSDLLAGNEFALRRAARALFAHESPRRYWEMASVVERGVYGAAARSVLGAAYPGVGAFSDEGASLITQERIEAGARALAEHCGEPDSWEASVERRRVTYRRAAWLAMAAALGE